MTEISRVYIAGCGGMLGEAVFRAASAFAETRASDLTPRESWLNAVDVAQYHDLRGDVMSFRPDLLVNLAAQTDLEFCELHPEVAWDSNALGAENCALLAQELQIPHVYISTAGIFDGEKDTYSDYDAPGPLTVYAKSKLHGERFVASHVQRHYVLRAGWMMGGGPKLDKKFVNKIFAQIKSGAETIYAVTDRLGTPTYTYDFANNLFMVARSGLYGTYNQVSGGKASRFDVACEFVNQLGVGNRVRVVPVTSDYFSTEYFAARPASEQLVNDKLTKRGLNGMRHWRDALAEYVEQYKQDLGSD